MQLSKHDKETINEVYHFINCNFRHHIHIASLIKQFDIAETTLTRGFKQLYGKTIYQYRLIISMEYAKSKIEDGRQIKQIQEELGYKTSGSFARAYKKVFAHQPTSIYNHVKKSNKEPKQ